MLLSIDIYNHRIQYNTGMYIMYIYVHNSMSCHLSTALEHESFFHVGKSRGSTAVSH